MAKIKLVSSRSKFWKGHRAGRPGRPFNVKVQIHRQVRQKNLKLPGFYACASTPGRKMRRHLTFTTTPGAKHEAAHMACSSGRNPRIAAGRALAKLGRALAHRTGAFHGL